VNCDKPLGLAKLLVAMNSESQEEYGIPIDDIPDDELEAMEKLKQLNELVRMTV
jgi:hypothetical protein